MFTKALSSEFLDSSNLKKLYLLNYWIAVFTVFKEALSSGSLDSSV